MSQPNRRTLQLIHRRKRLRQELWLAAVELVCWPVGKPGRERIEQDLHNVLQRLRYAYQHNPQHVESHILTVQRHITRIFNSQEKPTMITVQNLIEQLKHMPPNLPVRVNLSSVTICYEDGQDTFNLDETDAMPADRVSHRGGYVLIEGV